MFRGTRSLHTKQHPARSVRSAGETLEWRWCAFGSLTAMQFSRCGRDATPSLAPLTYNRGMALSTPKTADWDSLMNPSEIMIRLLIGGFIAAGVAASAVRLRLLTSDGAAAATAIGAVIVGFGGWAQAGLMFLFFLTSTLLTRVQGERKPHPEHGRGRSGDQVLANGIVATLLAVWHGVSPTPLIAAGFAGAIAASTADTWATEIGLLSSAPPKLITTWHVVPPGQSGAISLLGTAGGVGGALLIAAVGSWWVDALFGVVWLAGVAAMMFDSLLGATLEGRVEGVNNNTVNLIATAAGALLGVLLS